MNWAVTLIIVEESIEDRLWPIVFHVIKENLVTEFAIHDIDGTGQYGSQLTQKMNAQKGGFSISEEELSTLASEEGQNFELDLFLKGAFGYRFIVRDGGFIDILGNGEQLPPDVVGNYMELDASLFSWHTAN